MIELIEIEERGDEEMGVTISTHNGSSVAREHNIRNKKVVSKEEHIDMQGEHETWIDEPIRKAYDRLFGQAVQDYNEKQTREDRKIKSYYNDVCKDAKKHPCYEMIIGVYGKDENGATICTEEQGKAIMKQFVEGWRKRNPNLELIGAYYHNDEQGEPHCHIDYVPVAHGYNRGMNTQSGLVKAFEEMGITKQGRATAQIQWEARENKVLEKICNEYGLEVDHPRAEGREHISTAQYRAEKYLESAIDNTKDLLDMQDDLRAETSHLEAVRDKANKQTERALNRKAKAVKLHKDKDGQGWTYDRKLADGIKQIAKEVKEDVKAISHTDNDVQAQYDQAEAFRREQEQEIREKKAKAQKYLDNQESYILGTAENIEKKHFEQFKEEAFKITGTDREERMEKFLAKITFGDGSTGLQQFKKEEIKRAEELTKQFEHHRSRDWDFER